MAKYSTKINLIKMTEIYKSIPSHLSKDYNKFKYSLIKKGSASKNYVESLDILNLARVTIPVYSVEKPRITLEGESDISKFKLYLSDVGFLTRVANLSYKELNEGEFSYLGWVTENFVTIHLRMNISRLFYWYLNTYELDFLIKTKEGIVPIDVKSGRSKRSSSMKQYIKHFSPKKVITVSKDNFLFDGNQINFPLYAVFLINEFSM